MQEFIGTARLCNNPIVTKKEDLFIANFRIAISNDGESKSDFLNCVAFRKKAEWVSKYLRAGMKVEFIGKIRTGSYEKDGFTIPTIKLLISHIGFAESKAANEKYYTENPRTTDLQEESPGYESFTDDVPFVGIDGILNCPECGCDVGDTDRNCPECGARL